MIVKKTMNRGGVIDVACELGYDLRMDNYSLSTDQSFRHPLSTTFRMFCSGREWYYFDNNQINQQQSYSSLTSLSNQVVKPTIMETFPQCEGKKRAISSDFIIFFLII